MYTVNLIDLQSSEFEELELLVDAERRGEDVCALARQRIFPHGKEHDCDARKAEIYRGLQSVGLIVGVKYDGGFIFRHLTQKGLDFIDDYRASEKAEVKRTKDQRRHDYKIAAFGWIGGGIMGAVVSLFLYFVFGI
ncbi:MAG: hypothetical protein IKL97_05730 [Eggerthellaceae bacterium]|nr:hypothetical protein [Eggerthellaceae bacterium]